jgi:hypothetical protein
MKFPHFLKSLSAFLFVFLTYIPFQTHGMGHVYIIDQSVPTTVPFSFFTPTPAGGDTIKILSSRTHILRFNDLIGTPNNPIVIINSGGQVNIEDSTFWGALTFVNCKYIKVSGKGSSSFHFGFRLSGQICGLAFTEYSSDCEVENIEIHNTLFFGIYAKKDFGGSPPLPLPRFNNLVIHDTYIHHVEEGMYIGETKSPGMEFHHLRIYNNVVSHCGREAIQLANCVEDIEVYNNLCTHTGLAGLYAQANIFQIGGNTIGRFYNNIFTDAMENGLICLGSGDIEVFNNYISNNDGIYCDNREFNIPFSSVSFRNNFFRNIVGTEVILNANEMNDLHIRDNKYNTNISFAKSGKPAPVVWDVIGNVFQSLDSIRYTIINGLFVPDSSNSNQYSHLGPLPGISYQMNCTPLLDTIGAIIVSFGDTLSKSITATTSDNDLLSFTVLNMPSFAQFSLNGNGQAILNLVANQQNKGIYHPTILVHDSSNRQYARETFKLAIKDPTNHDPQLFLPALINMASVSKFRLNITAKDIDNDPITYSFINLPEFISTYSTPDSAWIDIKPLLGTTGSFNFKIIVDDGYGNPDTANIQLEITPLILTPGKVIYRLNCAGPELEDNPINWQYDIGRDAVLGSSFSYGTGSHTWKGVNSTGAPDNLFGPFRHYGPSPSTMGWSFPVPTNGMYRIKLFFAERPTEVTSGTTGTFDISIEDSTILHAFNIYADMGYAACVKQFDVTVNDSRVDVQFTPEINDAKINGFEVMFLEAGNNPPSVNTFGNTDLPEGDSLNIILVVNDDNFQGCNNISLTLSNAPGFMQLIHSGNNWFLKSKPSNSDAGNYPGITLTITDGCLSSTLLFNTLITDVFVNTSPQLAPFTAIFIGEGETLTYNISASDPDNQILSFSFSGMPTFMQYQPIGNGNGKIIFSPGYTNSGYYAIIVNVADPMGGIDLDTLHVNIIDAPEIIRIPLNSSMITDLVRPPYGSSISPAFLVDEQALNPVTNQHPSSASWKPYYNLAYAPYHFYLDLGFEYVIKKIYLHDMNSVANLDVWYGAPGQWAALFTEPCNAYNTWKLHETSITTRYIQLSMINTISAAVNEIILYGYLANEKNAPISEFEYPSSEIVVYPNPCNSLLTISNMEAGSMVEMYSITGKLLISSKDSHLETGNLAAGIYLIALRDRNGTLKSQKKIIITQR